MMTKIQDIPFRRIPHQTTLFLDYLDHSPKIQCYLPNQPIETSLESLSRKEASNNNYPRNKIAQVLYQQSVGYSADARVRERIADLEKPDSVAIVTGQQVGIFTGPLYTAYKALTALELAERLRKLGIRAVAVFWMETEDHDFAESSHRTVIDSEDTLQHIDYGRMIFEERDIALHSVGSIRFPDSIRSATHHYLERIPESAWKADIAGALESAYAPGTTFALAFARLFQHIFRNTGLILFDPSDPEAKRLAAPIFARAMAEAAPIAAALMERSRALVESGFHAQAAIQENSTLLFFRRNQRRRALVRGDTGFGLKDAPDAFTQEELSRILTDTPEAFSPNVLLRPIIQDHLFPTAAYVGGAAEAAYFAQAEILYRMWKRPMPLIWPRDSFTLIDPEVGGILTRWEAEISDCWSSGQSLENKAVRTGEMSGYLEKLKRLQKHLDASLETLRPEIISIETGLEQRLDSVRKKISWNMERLQTGVLRKQGDRSASIVRLSSRVRNRCYPNGKLQERELTILPFLARYGPDFILTIRNAALGTGFPHRVLFLSPDRT